MSRGVVFKQRYKPRNAASTTILNRKHLIYIATRPGAVHNPGCGFGLWGRLPGDTEIGNINDFRKAKETVTQASKVHTLYRAMFSVDDETGKQHGLYDRKTWEKLLERKIHVLADEMGIRQKDFCWVASMHYEKGHPHVHVMYWDNSDAIHQEGMPEEHFKIMAERIRSEFGRDIYHDEILDKRKEQDEEIKELRLKLRAMLKDANLAEALNLSHVKGPTRDRLTSALANMAATAPTHGRLNYGFLKADYKKKVDAFIDEVLKISDFQKILKSYDKTTQEISILNGNGDEKIDYELKKAHEKLHRDMGNEIMDAIRACRKELAMDAPSELDQLRVVIQSTAEMLLRANPKYTVLLDQMPKLRTPIGVLMKNEAFAKHLHDLARDVCSDIRISARLIGYVDATGVEGREERKESLSKAYRDAHRCVVGLILDDLKQDAGYLQQAQADIVTNLLIRLMGEASRSTRQQQASRDLLVKHQERSKTAQRDRQAQLAQGSSIWPEQ